MLFKIKKFNIDKNLKITVSAFLDNLIETDFEKVEKLYHDQCYGDYESLKRKNSGKLYD